MRNLEVIETELAAAREALSNIKGTPTEVYSRIVGYYRSVRNWNRGKREEYNQRVLFEPDTSLFASCTTGTSGGHETPGHLENKWSGGQPLKEDLLNSSSISNITWSLDNESAKQAENTAMDEIAGFEERIILFVRQTCPSCPSAQAAAGRLGIPIELYDADTEEGLAEAVRYQILSTPTAILISPNGNEMGRAHNAQAIKGLLELDKA